MFHLQTWEGHWGLGLKWQHREEGNGGKISREFWEECDFRFVFVFEFEIFPFFLSDLLSDQVSER